MLEASLQKTRRKKANTRGARERASTASACSLEKNGCRSPKRSRCKWQVLEIRAPKKARCRVLLGAASGHSSAVSARFFGAVPRERQWLLQGGGHRGWLGQVRKAQDKTGPFFFASQKVTRAGRPTHDGARAGDGGKSRWGICSYPRTGGCILIKRCQNRFCTAHTTSAGQQFV